MLKKQIRKSSATGFTIVELLIVIVVIAILAAITIVAYNGIKNRADESAMQSDLRSLATILQNEKTTSGGYPATLESLNGGSGPKTSNSNQFNYEVTADSFCVSITSSVSNKKFYVTSVEGAVKEGGCPGPWSYVANGWYTSCGVSKSALYCWGDNANGELGNGTTISTSTPSAVDASGVLAGKTITKVAGGWRHTCAIASARAYCWGNNDAGQVGRPGFVGYEANLPNAVYVNDGTYGFGMVNSDVVDITAGEQHTCAAAGGQAWCWGKNGNDQLGTGSGTFESVPVQVATDTGLAGKTVTQVATKNLHTCALASGQVYCWGTNWYGELGDGSTAQAPKPTATVMTGALAGKTVTKITVGNSVTCAVASGKAYCWGSNSFGALGNGGTGNRTTPAPVDDSGALAGKTIVDIAAGVYHTCALTADSQVYCWGAAQGAGLSSYSASPSQVNVSSALSGKAITEISAGNSHSCAKTDDNWVYCWGYNNSGQLGNGSSPAQPITKVVAP